MTTQHERDEIAIEEHIGRIAEGIRARDIEALRPLYAEDVVSFDVEPPLQHVGVDAKLANWTRVFTVFQEVDYEVRDLILTVGDEVAFGRCFGRLHGTLANGTKTEGMWVRATICLQKRDGAWTIVHDQASVPFDVVSGKGVADLQP
ncbi:YybH family protein [Catenulispora subtropica]|uniref:SnoaL-like domain-containing protein n=1 Tax=Catenulispora subtropica TaxID=450798 RepID=A0ABP5DI71_9ACTN